MALSKKKNSGFTLVEVLVATTISAVVIAMTMSSFIFLLRSHHHGRGKLLINNDLRTFTSELSDNATYATTFSIYSSFTARTDVDDTASGDFLVLEYRDPDNTENVSKIVGYYRAADIATNRGPVQTFTLNFSPSSESDVIDLLPATTTSGSHKEVVQLSEGLSDGRLFMNFRNLSVVVRGEIIHDGAVGNEVSNTYNFTVFPRG